MKSDERYHVAQQQYITYPYGFRKRVLKVIGGVGLLVGIAFLSDATATGDESNGTTYVAGSHIATTVH